jgi:glycosyltransferase involved in cell wall biosynthesis
MKKKNIAFINDTFVNGRGADTVIYELAKRLGKRHNVYVLAGETNIVPLNFKFIQLNLPKLLTGKISDFKYFEKMRKLNLEMTKLEEKYKFEKLFVCHGGLSPAFNSNKKVTYIWMGSPSNKNPLRKIIAWYFKRKMKENEIITISKFMKNELEKAGAKKIKIISLGVSNEFKPSKNKKEFMLYVGRLEKHKNVKDLIKIAKNINFPLRILGYGPEEEKLKKFAKKINAPILFLGRVSRKELVENYQKCTFFVSGSKWEGFGLIFIEAGACGKPSVGYNKGAIAEVIVNKKTGFVVDNFKEFQKSVKSLKENDKLRNKMGRAALKESKKYNWNKIIEGITKDI